ncbi:amino acid adenylation domain-containing protein [Algoriphagus sp. 4150]|uniref:non-ribosomal peptide synthetase n=1 Tax=Algoriphagus sp. 4150 TaxID=2817756 RepID=UPI00285EC54A|nr:amino acid adenylation domain-containing protein [Algoriphagus sp. 4150]MDR7131774.1 amino acid adenylation domain-containing protein [Algoriphagus sp. 4150]
MKRIQDNLNVGSEVMRDEAVISKVFPSTPSQMEIWLQCYLGGKEASMAYNESNSFRMYGDLMVDILKEAFQVIVSRHEGMRAVFTPDGRQIIVFQSLNTSIRTKDISTLSEEEQEEFLKEHSIQTGFYEFDLVKGPLYVLDLIKINELEHMVTFTGHHLIFDGWSMGLLAEELSSVYGQLCKSDAVAMPEPNKLSDYVLKNLRLTNSAEMARSRDFWVNNLSNPLPFLELPIDFERPKVRMLKAARVEHKAASGIMKKAKKYAASQHASLNVLLLSIFEIVLSKWTESRDVVIGMPRAGQPLLGCSNMIGHSVHLLPIRAKVDFDLTFEEYLTKRRIAFMEVLDHGTVSFGELIQSLQIKRDPSRIPLLPLTFNVEIGLEQGISFDSLKYRFISNPKAYSNFEIILNIFGSLNKSVFEWTYNESLFDKSSIHEIARIYDHLIQRLVECPTQKLSIVDELFEEVDLSGLLDNLHIELTEHSSVQENGSIEKEADVIIREESSVSSNESENETDPAIPVVIAGLLESAVSFPDKIAIVTGENSLSYKILNTQSNQLAALLREKGVRPGDIVGVYMERSNATVVSIMGILKAGAAYMPIDVEVPAERVSYMLKNSNSKCYITDQPAFDNGELADIRLLYTDVIEMSAGFPTTDNPTKTPVNNPMYIIYTSGSTGNPKAVCLSRKNLDYFIDTVIVDLKFCAEDVVAAITSVSFDAATLETLIPYSFGATVHMLDKYQRRDPKEILRVFEEKKITKTIATPTHWQLIANSGWNTKIPSLTVMTIGEPLKKALVDHIAPLSKEIFNLYGPAETTVYSTFKKVSSSDSRITIGKAVPGTTVYLVDKSGSNITEPGVSGEIWIGGDGVGLGYLGLKELTAEKFVSNSFDQSPKNLYKTGDLGFWLDTGEIQCEGRIDHQVKIRGHRIELGEIEQRILGFDEVSNAVVDTDKSSDIVTLIGFVSIKKELRDFINLDAYADKLRERLLIGLPDYMVPTEYRFVEEFKLTTSGKIDRKQLPGRQTQGVEKQVRVEKFAQDLTPVEKTVYSIWKDLLGNSKLSLDDDFFLVGGHSLMGVKLISILEKKFHLSLSLLTLFQYPTVRSLSALIAKETTPTGTDSLVLIKNGSPDKVLCFVHGVGLNPIEINTLIKNMDEDQTIWGLQSPAISGNARPFESIPEMASHFIKELDEKGIKSPFNLIGNSIGGIIVFEMAKQLISANRKLGFISMIDTIGQFFHDEMPTVANKTVKLTKKLQFEFQFLLDDMPYYLRHRKNNLKEKWRNFKGINSNENDLSKRIREIELINYKAWREYVMEPIDIELTLFLAKKKTFFVEDFKTLGWEKYTTNVVSITMPGEHANMLKPPHGIEFSRVLQQRLNLYTIQ